MCPFNSLRIDLAKIVGRIDDILFDDVVINERLGILREGSIKRVQEKYVGDDNIADEDVTRQVQEEAVGATDETFTDNYRTKTYKCVRGLVSLDLDDTGLTKDYEFQFLLDERVLVRLAPSRYNCKERNYYRAAILPKSRSFWGRSIPMLLENNSDVEGTLLRQLIDSNTITNVPTFKASAADKTWYEDHVGDLRFEPGRIFWLRNPSSMERFDTKSINAGDFLRIIQYNAQSSETESGANRTLAGQPLIDDPNAPGVKTKLLTQQSNFLVNRYITNIRAPIKKVLRFIYELYRERIGIKEYTINRKGLYGSDKKETITISQLPNLPMEAFFDIRPQKVDDNEQLRNNEMRQDLELMMSDPMYNQNPYTKRILFRNYLSSKDYLSMEEVEELLRPIEETHQQLSEAMAAQSEADNLGKQQEENVSKLQQLTDETGEALQQMPTDIE